MKYKKLGNSDLQVSTITFGCWELGGGPWEFTSDENNIRTLQKAFELGITTFDTAEGYGDGHSEEIVGHAFEGKRKEIVISTKVGRANLAPDNVLRSAENSLKRLKTDYIDIYYIHWPSFEVPVADTLAVFNRLKDEGIIRAIGVSNFSIEQLREAVQYARIDVIQPEYSLLHRGIESEIVPFCLEQNIGIMGYSSIAKGILTGAFHSGHSLSEDDFRRKRRLFQPEHLEAEQELISAMREIAEAKGASVSQVAIAWLLHQKGVTTPIIGTQSERHLIDNAAAADLELSSEQVARLTAISDNVLAKIGY